MLPIPIILWAVFRRKRLSLERWAVAFAEMLVILVPTIQQIASQSSRFTSLRWLSDLMLNPVFTINGAAVSPQSLTSILLLFAVVFAAYRISSQEQQRRAAVEQEFRSARELQRVLIPDQLPATPGYALTSSYKPASEVGGDFFQIVPLADGDTLVVLGDVSGKGLKAAMAVALIVGMVRALAGIIPGPSKLLAEINNRLEGRLQGGFATAIALRLDRKGWCSMASAGHLSPFLNGREIDLPGAFPLGLVTGVVYEEKQIRLNEADCVAIYTDGLLEARDAEGELFGFERVHKLFEALPSAEKALGVAVQFGQDDDITVLTLTRVVTGGEGVAGSNAPRLVTA
jgi:serine phosphatase RsbU (regulator of sigma subunit)